MESVFDKAAGLTETGIGANISPEDKAFIAMYNAGRGLIDCINFYVKRYENDKDCFACFIAGKLYFIKKDYINALNYFEKFCDSVDENTISIFRHIDIREVTLDWETLKGIKIDILCIVANMYQNENGAKKDINKIIYYYEQSSILDNANAFVELGKIYKSDSDTDRDYNKSFMYYKKAVDLGKDDIAKDLIDTFLEGYGIEVDIDTIIEYAKKAKIGEDKIYKKFGDLYRDGKGIEQNIEKAIEYYKQGKIDESIYCKELGDLYNEGKYIKRNDSLAFQYYAKAKYKDGLVERYKLIQLGNYCFNYHRNKDIDINKFVECYKKAGVEYLDIYHTLWYMMKGNYFNCFSFRDSRQYNFKADKFIPKEIEQFIEHFRCFGFTDAMIYEQLGNLFCEARYEMDKQHYMPLIIELAKYYYKKAGRDEFLAYYNTECGSLYVESKAEKKAIEQYQQSAENGDSDSYVRLGQIYESYRNVYEFKGFNGWGLLDTEIVIEYPFMDKAIEYYKKACDMGNPNGYYALWWLSYNVGYNRSIHNTNLRLEKIFKLYGDSHYQIYHRWNNEEGNANKYAQKALSLYHNIEHKNDGEIYYKIGVLYEFAMNDINKANEYYKKAYLNGSVNGYEVYYRIGEYNKIFEQKYGYRHLVR